MILPGRNRRRAPRTAAALAFLVVAAVIAIMVSLTCRRKAERPACLRAGTHRQAAVPVDSAAAAEPAVLSHAGHTVRSGENLATVLAALGLTPEQARLAHDALGRTDFDFQRLLPGDSVTLELRDSVPARISYHVDLATAYEVRFGPGGVEAGRVIAPVETTVVVLAGTLSGSLWQSLLDAGADDRLVAAYTSILRNRLPRLRDMQPGDSFQVVVERLTVGGRFFGYGNVNAAHYRGSVDAWALHHSRPDGLAFYCDTAGRSLGPVLSYPPVADARRTSDFGPRLHPVLRRRIQHNGFDYEAPYGAAVRAVAAGEVSRVRWRGGYGRTVEVTHNAPGLVTRYSHLSRYAAGLKVGSAVKQGDTIGFVGSTGLSSGAHLDFGVLRAGRHVDPLGALPSRVEEVEPGGREEFRQFRDDCRALIVRALACLCVPARRQAGTGADAP